MDTSGTADHGNGTAIHSGTLHINVYMTPDGKRTWPCFYPSKEMADKYAVHCAGENHKRIAYLEIDWHGGDGLDSKA